MYVQFRGRDDVVERCTTANFHGVVAMMDPSQDKPGGSWVARWQHVSNLLPGVYALSATGTLPDEYAQQMAGKGKYRNRDTSVPLTKSKLK